MINVQGRRVARPPELAARRIATAAFAAAALALSAGRAAAQCSGLDQAYQLYTSTRTPRSYRRRLETLLKVLGPRRNFAPGKCVSAKVGVAGVSLARVDRASATVPAGALGLGAAVFIGDPEVFAPDQSPAMAARLQSLGLIGISSAVFFGPVAAAPTAAVSISLPYNGESEAGPSAGAPSLARWNPTATDWEMIPAQIDSSARSVTAAVLRLGTYQVVAVSSAAPSAAAAPGRDAFGFRAMLAFPNPAHGLVTLRIQTGRADSVEVTVRGMSGRALARANLGPPKLVDAGNGLGAQWTYDFLYEAPRSGLFVYTFVARAAGGEVVKSGKFAAIR